MSGTCAVDPRPTVENSDSVDLPAEVQSAAEASRDEPVTPAEDVAEVPDDAEETEYRE